MPKMLINRTKPLRKHSSPHVFAPPLLIRTKEFGKTRNKNNANPDLCNALWRTDKTTSSFVLIPGQIDVRPLPRQHPLSKRYPPWIENAEM